MSGVRIASQLDARFNALLAGQLPGWTCWRCPGAYRRRCRMMCWRWWPHPRRLARCAGAARGLAVWSGLRATGQLGGGRFPDWLLAPLPVASARG
jgi:hypothetical protein